STRSCSSSCNSCCSSKDCGQSDNCCKSWPIGSACAGTSDTIWSNPYPIIPASPAFGSATASRSSATFSSASSSSVLRRRLVWGQELYIDATMVAANAALASLHPRFAVEAHLTHLFRAEEDNNLGEGSGDPDEDGEGPEPEQWPVALPEDVRCEWTERAQHR